jgi:ATP-dependent NAD(P)H-hydrate dehydratase
VNAWIGSHPSIMATSSLSASSLLRRAWRSVVPKLEQDMHKGSCGRIAVVGGSADYSGAPYFAAISSMRCGTDLAYVLCPPEAALAIKAYAPDLCVRPLLDSSRLDECLKVLSTCHAVIVGPGVGDNTSAMKQVLGPVVRHVRSEGIPLVVDTSVMFFPEVLEELMSGKGSKEATKAPTYLTPNGREILGLVEGVLGKEEASKYADADENAKAHAAAKVALALRAVVIVKGKHDCAADGWSAEHEDATSVPISKAKLFDESEDPSPRRAAGQGDVMSGTIGTFAAWVTMAQKKKALPKDLPVGLLAPSCGCLVAREAACEAYTHRGRSMLASDVVVQLGSAMARIDAMVDDKPTSRL